jgi:HSP20 family protein
VEHNRAEMMGLLRESMPGQRWMSVRLQRVWRPPTDVYELDDCFVVKVEIAGMQGDDFNISLDGKLLTVGGARHDPSAKLAYQQMEISYGAFETEVVLPRAIDPNSIEANYQNGFLTVRLPKAQPRQVPIISQENA